MAFVYVPKRERWRTSMLLAWKKGDLRVLRCAGIMKRIVEYAAPPWPTDPVRKLTVNLIGTYTGINEAYYEAKKRWNGNFTWREGQELVLNGRYLCKKQIGSGAFGVVMHASDLDTGENVAIKIIKARPAYTMQAQREIRLLQNLLSQDVDRRSNVVELKNHFMHHGHQCIVFEMLSANLYSLLERVSFHGFSLPLVRKFADQLVVSLEFLSRSDVRVIHTDIKPENICIRNSKRSAIKLIDFGSSCQEGQRLFSYIQSRYYRSPEVLLNLEYTVAIDMWSLACVLVEMHLGKPLFSGDCQEDQLRKIMQVRGLPPDHMIDASPPQSRDRFFEPARVNDVRRWRPREAIKHRSLADILGVYTGGPEGRWRNEDGHTQVHYQQFMDLIQRMLEYDPARRIRPSEALDHPFLAPLAGYRKPAAPSREGSFAAAPTPSGHEPPSSRQERSSAPMAAMQTTHQGADDTPPPAAAAASSHARLLRGPRQRTEHDADAGRGPTAHISQQHQTELSLALHEIGCPESQLEEYQSLTWEVISELLERFTVMDETTLREARRMFRAFVEQPLRKRRDKALQDLLLFLRSQTHARQAHDPMVVDDSSSPAP